MVLEILSKYDVIDHLIKRHNYKGIIVYINSSYYIEYSKQIHIILEVIRNIKMFNFEFNKLTNQQFYKYVSYDSKKYFSNLKKFYYYENNNPARRYPLVIDFSNDLKLDL
ncbi:hypothetical protein [Capybara microvirus Cap3_SP_475]|nr:hypothetical protein [Capybara microvirus Cap3_SP_475]